MSLFVNPAQFDEAADLEAYPRTGEADSLLASSEGVDVLFAPDPDEVYPPGFATTVSVAGLTEVLEGEQRGRAHFDGVTTVVLKLLNMAVPDTAYFGQKDAQQAVVIARMVRDLDVPVRDRRRPHRPRGRRPRALLAQRPPRRPRPRPRRRLLPRPARGRAVRRRRRARRGHRHQPRAGGDARLRRRARVPRARRPGDPGAGRARRRGGPPRRRRPHRHHPTDRQHAAPCRREIGAR